MYPSAVDNTSNGTGAGNYALGGDGLPAFALLQDDGGAAVASMQCVRQPATQGKPAWSPGWDGPAGACAQRAASNGAAAATDSGNSKACKATA